MVRRTSGPSIWDGFNADLEAHGLTPIHRTPSLAKAINALRGIDADSPGMLDEVLWTPPRYPARNPPVARVPATPTARSSLASFATLPEVMSRASSDGCRWAGEWRVTQQPENGKGLGFEASGQFGAAFQRPVRAGRARSRRSTLPYAVSSRSAAHSCGFRPRHWCARYYGPPAEE